MTLGSLGDIVSLCYDGCEARRGCDRRRRLTRAGRRRGDLIDISKRPRPPGSRTLQVEVLVVVLVAVEVMVEVYVAVSTSVDWVA